MENKKIYFISDAHLGYPNHQESLKREKKLVSWLAEIKSDCRELYLLGDIFDFWYEYKRVVPKGFTRLFGTLAEFTDAGIPVYFFTGNHDIWAFDYFEKEIGILIERSPREKEILGKTFYLAHGDGLGNGEKSFKMLKKLFTNKTAQWFFSRLHPNFSIWLANSWSQKSRLSHGEPGFKGEEKEIQYMYAKELSKGGTFDYIVMGHRHLPNIYEFGNTRFINLGDWLEHFSYGVFDGNDFFLKEYKE